MKLKMKMMVLGGLLSLSLIGCGNVGNVKPIDGDNRTVSQMTNEVEANLKDAPNNFGFNAVWTR